MKIPTISLAVVINGPVASAGSILNLDKVKGTNAPKILAKIITVNNEMLTLLLNCKSCKTK